MPHRDPRRVRAVILAALLLGAAVFVYRGTGGFDFVNLDDPDYVTQNPAVQGGLNWNGLRWAFTAFHSANWHPLTWLSHMADASLFGSAAGPQHLVNLGLHAAAALALFQVLFALTGSFWRCAAVAALFAVHPVQVESVAWISERKTVLAALPGLLAVHAYLRYVARPASASLAGTAALFAVGLLAKPMLVVLPLLLLLLDWWPLGRFGRRGLTAERARVLVVEKVPLFGLALLSGILTLAAQSRVGAVAPLQILSLPVRLGNALLSYAAYLGDLFVPRNLSPYYEHPSGGLPWGVAGLAAFALAAVTLLVWRRRRSAPWATFGWLWYVLTLLPVIGVVQVGSQARADRYLYLPLVGIFLAVVWGAAELARRRPRSRVPVSLAIGTAIALLALAAHRQAGYWRDSGTLWEHALSVNPTSETALYQLSEHHGDLGQFADQAALLSRLVRLDPRNERARNNLVIARYRLGVRPQDLLVDYEALLEINPGNTKALQNYGYLLIETGRYADAVATLERAVGIDPGYCAALNNLGRAHLALGDKSLAGKFFEQAIACDPHRKAFRANLELVR